MANDNKIEHLNHLIRINQDAEAGFHSAAGKVQNSELDSVFTGYAKQHAKFAAELQEEIERLGGEPSPAKGIGSSLHHGFNDLKAALSGHSPAALLASCESGEESAEIAYTDAADGNPTGQIHALIDKHRKQIIEIRKRLARLVGETKSGFEFQKNE